MATARRLKPRYQFKSASKLPRKLAQKVGEEIEQIRSRKGRRGVSATDVLEHAASPRTALHRLFESRGLWDDEHAAHQYRLTFARQVLRSITVTYSATAAAGAEPFRAWVHLQDNDEDEDDEYLQTAAVLQNDVLRRRLLRQAKREADLWMARYRQLHELKEVFDAIGKIKV